MTVLGGTSGSERQHVQALVRAAVDVQGVDGSDTGLPGTPRLHDRERRAAPRPAQGGGGVPVGAGGGRAVGGGRATDLPGARRRRRRPRHGDDAQRDGVPAPVSSTAGAEPAPAGRRVAGQSTWCRRRSSVRSGWSTTRARWPRPCCSSTSWSGRAGSSPRAGSSWAGRAGARRPLTGAGRGHACVLREGPLGGSGCAAGCSGMGAVAAGIARRWTRRRARTASSAASSSWSSAASSTM